MFDKLKQKAVALAKGISEVELKVLNATNEDKWGPHGKDMQEIARDACHEENFHLVMAAIWNRLSERDENWRLCYKALLLCEFLIKQGPMRAVHAFRENINAFERLRDSFEYKDMEGRDQGINVRQRARELAALLADPNRVQAEREKAKQNAGKYTGVSAADMARGGSGFGGGGGYSGGGGGYGGYGSGSGYGSGGDLGSYGGGGGSGGHSRTGSGNVGGYGGLQSPGGAREGGAGGSGGNSFHARSGSGSMHGMGSSAGAQEVEDPFEATRRRIERLKADGSLGSPGGEGGSSSAAAAAAAGPAPLIPSSINMDASANLFPEQKARLGPKKLSEVKVNPAIAAAFGTPALTPGSSSSSLGGLALAPPPPARAGSSSVAIAPPPQAQPQQQASSNAVDLLGGLDIAAPAAPAQGSAGGMQAAGSGAAAAIDWDALTFSAAPAQAPVQASQPAPAIDLLGDFTAAPAPAPSAGGPTPAAALFDAFGPSFPTTSAPAPAAPAPSGGLGMPGLLGKPPAATGSIGVGVAAGGGAPKLGPGLNKPKDPFADLLN